MKIRDVEGLPLVMVHLQQGERNVIFENVLLDTGSAGSIFSVDKLEQAGITPRPNAMIRRIVGVGGVEFVVEVKVDAIKTGKLQLEQFVIEAGGMDYGFDFDGILGFDFLRKAGAVIDFAKMEIRL